MIERMGELERPPRHEALRRIIDGKRHRVRNQHAGLVGEAAIDPDGAAPDGIARPGPADIEPAGHQQEIEPDHCPSSGSVPVGRPSRDSVIRSIRASASRSSASQWIFNASPRS